MYFSRIRFRQDVTPDKEWIVENLYQSHRTLWRLFPERNAGQRNFLFRENDANNNQLEFYIVSPHKPVDQHNYWDMETKPYQPVVDESDEFRFSLRVNPVVTKTDSETGKKSRHDVVMNLKKEWKEEHSRNPRGPEFQELIRQAGIDWLASRCESHGFWFNREQLLVSRYLQHKLTKKQKKSDFSKHKDKKRSDNSVSVQFSTLDFEGVLKVIDPATFEKCLFQGLGPSKSFGCGLMLVKRLPKTAC